MPVLLLARTASPRWSYDPALNTCIDDDAGDQGEPRVPSTPDGGRYVRRCGAPSARDVRLQSLDPQGKEPWARNGIPAGGSLRWGPAGTALVSTASGFPAAPESAATTDGNAVVARARDPGTVVTRLDLTGSPPWGGAPPAIFDAGSLQMGSFPDFVPGGSGGAVFAWGAAPGAAYNPSTGDILFAVRGEEDLNRYILRADRSPAAVTLSP